MHIRIPIPLPPGSVKPLAVIVRRRDQLCRRPGSMGPRRRKQLIVTVGLVVTTMLFIQYNGRGNDRTEHNNVRLRYFDPSLPIQGEGYENSGALGDKLTNSQDRRIHNSRGLGRHLQEENLSRNQEQHRIPISDAVNNVRVVANLGRTDDNNGDDAIEAENSMNSLGSHVTIIPAHRIPLSYLRIQYCPACIGTSLCDEFRAGNVTAFHDLSQLGTEAQAVPGSWDGKGVTLRFPSEERIARFTEYVCEGYSDRPDDGDGSSCDVSKAIMNSNLSRTDLDLSPHEMKQRIFEQDDEPASIISPTTCAYGEFFAKVKRQFHIHNHTPGRPNNSRKMASLMSNLLFDPLPMVIQFIKKEVPQLLPYLPKYLGACGHVTMVEEEGLPLVNFIPDPWESRVGLTLAILQFIDDLWNASSRWGFVLLDFNYRNFVVLPSGGLQLTTPEKLLVVDKEYFQDVLKVDTSQSYNRPTCNKLCLVRFLNQLILTNHTQCMLTTNPQQFMYMMASHMLLSDLYTTQHIKFFEGKQLLDENHPGGLLYDVPSTMDAKLSQLLYECILETQGGSRTSAVRTIRRLLQIVQKGFNYKKIIEENKKKVSVAHPG